MTIPGAILMLFFAYAILSPDGKRRKTPQQYRIERIARHNEKRVQLAAERAAMLGVVDPVERKPRRARRTSQPTAKPKAVQPKAAQPAFLKDVESALQNLQYSKVEAKQAVQRSTGDDFNARLKNALMLLRIPDAKLTA